MKEVIPGSKFNKVHDSIVNLLTTHYGTKPTICLMMDIMQAFEDEILKQESA